MMTGWSRIERRRDDSLGGDRRTFQRYHELPAGPMHAVEEDADTALCGAVIVFKGQPWPGGIGDRCGDCLELMVDAPGS